MANTIAEALAPFVWGAGGAKKTPEQVAREREIAEAILMKAGNTSPVGHWTQGAARVVDALGGVIKERRAAAGEREIADVNKGLISSLLGGGSTSSSSVPMTGAAGEVAATSPAVSGATGPEAYRNAIASIESAGSGDYSAIGPANDKLGRPLGRYQVMEANIGPWSQEALGRAVTPDEFLASPEIQDAIFDKKFGSYVQQFGPEGAAQAWFAGPGGVGATGRQDVLGTSVGEYGNRFTSALGPTEVASASPQAAIDAVTLPDVGQSAVPAQAAIDTVTQAMPAQQPVQMAGGGDRPTAGMNPAIIEALTNPQASPQTQRIAGILLQQEQARQQAMMEQEAQARDPLRQLQLQKGQLELEQLRNPQAKVPEAVQALDLRAQRAGLQPGTPEYNSFMISGGKEGTSVTVNTGESDKFYENLDKKNAEMFSALSEEGVRGRGKLAQIDRLETLMTNSPQGAMGALKQAAGEYGINTEGLSDIQSAQALINELVPQQRQPGSGPMSDADLALFKQSLPRIINQPGGNEAILQTMRGITQYQIQMGEIADAVADRTMKPEEARKAIRGLENPLDAYTKLVRQQENDDQDAGWNEVDGVKIRKK